MLCLADLCPGQWAAQDRTDIAKVEHPGAQRENAECHGDHAERVIPEQITNYEKSRAGDQAKNAPARLLMNRENHERLKASALLMAHLLASRIVV